MKAFGFRHPRVSSRVLHYLGWEIIILTKWEITLLLKATPSPMGPCKIKSTRLRMMLKILGIYRRCLRLVSNSLWLCLLCHWDRQKKNASELLVTNSQNKQILSKPHSTTPKNRFLIPYLALFKGRIFLFIQIP